MPLKKENIVLVDDDIDILELLQRHLQAMGYHTYKALSVKEAVVILKDKNVDLLITDIQMPEVDGLQLLKFAAEHYPNLPKLVITGYPSVQGSLEVLNSGAAAYLTKPFTKSELKEAVDKVIKNQTKPKSLKASTKVISDVYQNMVGVSPAFLKVIDVVERVKNNKATVFVQGESGTGKELVARAIHYSGAYARAPFIAVNCAAIPENLLESELFGYLKGAFTGANENRDGFFQTAAGGTLFLDEIGEASLAVQTRLLRALQEKEVVRVGARKAEKIDLRIIAATNANLKENIANKTFRLDLYYRLTVVEIDVPPLRERKEDIPLLVQKFLFKYGVEYKDRLLSITPDALRILQRYHWPGNIRELENIIQRIVIMSDGIIGIAQLPDFLKYEIIFPETDLLPLRSIEKQYVQQVLNHTDGNKTQAAKILEIDRKTLREKLK